MKQIVFVIFLFIFLYSCEFEQFEFSCDPVINDYVIDNIDELSKISLDQYNTYELPMQQAIFRSWSYVKRRDAWVEKLEYVLENSCFTEQESLHIKTLIDHIDYNYFDESTLDKNSDNENQFESEWIDYAKVELGWSDFFIAFIVYRLYTVPEQMYTELSYRLSAEELESIGSEPCYCNSIDDWCSSGYCYPDSCDYIPMGCGFLKRKSCDGICG